MATAPTPGATLLAQQLASLGLRVGVNTVKFSVHSGMQGLQAVSARLFLFEHTTRLVVSDVVRTQKAPT